MTTELTDPRIVGQRLAEARKGAGLTQEVAAEHLGMSRPTFIAIEKGERPPRPGEVVKLATLYGRAVHDLVRSSPPAIDLQPHLRAVADKFREVDAVRLRQAISDLQRFAEDYRELERLTNVPLRENYPPAVHIDSKSRVNPSDLAEDVAVRERQRFGLGNQPIHNLRGLLEWEVGVRLFYGDLPSAVAGMYAYAEGLGGCIMINRHHPAERRRLSIVHEYGHLIVDRFKAGVDYLSAGSRKPSNERFVESFSHAFLMPASSVRHRFHETVAQTGDFQRSDLFRLKHFYFVSLEAMTLRLESLGLIPRGSWDLLKEEKVPVREAERKLSLNPLPVNDSLYPERYRFLAVRAYDSGQLTEGELARYLRCEHDLWRVREIVRETLQSPEIESDGRAKTIQADDMSRSLLAGVS